MQAKIEEFQDIIPTGGTCMASSKITEEGLKVGFMYREEPEDEFDTGWRFYSGTEDDDYVENPDNISIYDVNTIANYDRAIVAMLKKPIGSEWERVEGTNRFQLLEEE
ncbi:MAG: hypothetical protein CFE21_19785 [Bacteroidetes bacterium B1(2017)]|jgi:hypothetical protein|nr:DUF2185 domain-containing protein [Leadbetterella sp.]OYU93636.1 MAG: hypothetical protein CFE21_19785 [Bacteroidetes bacterium B1(2017)]